MTVIFALLPLAGNAKSYSVNYQNIAFEKVINDQRDMLEQFAKEAPVLGTVKKSADAYRSVLEGTPVVKSNRKSDVAREYVEIASKI